MNMYMNMYMYMYIYMYMCVCAHICILSLFVNKLLAYALSEFLFCMLAAKCVGYKLWKQLRNVPKFFS